jgi:uncharacterized protein YydD (DUF2326 family)
MIQAVRASGTGFKDVQFGPGFNVVLAERTKESTIKDSRNGLGKSTLIDIIHFCLGSNPERADTLRQEPLEDWTFELQLELREKTCLIRRSTSDPGKVLIYGDTSDWPIPTKVDKDTGEPGMSRDEWTRLLGWAMFGFSPDRPDEKYAPTFRSLISYFARRGQGAFINPFEQYPRQQEWDKQVNTAFLLGLNWQHAQQWQLLKDQEKELKQLRRVLRTGVAADLFGSLGSLESARVRLEREVAREERELAGFQVHPQYREIQEEANRLTFTIHDLTNANVVDRSMISLYEQSLQEESPPDEQTVAELFAEAGVTLNGSVVRRLGEVQSFHREIVVNRRRFLEGEIEGLRGAIADREPEVERLSRRRAELLDVLRSHGALDDYNRLQQLHGAKIAQLEDLDRRIVLWQKLERQEITVNIERERLKLDARSDLDDRRSSWEEAIALFNANSEALYESSGQLAIDLRDTGFKFAVNIERSGSQGIDHMKVFCFDLMLAQVWAQNPYSPGFLIHDSIIFDGVDERQRARALQLAAHESAERGFQYICCLNSDMIPYAEFDESFNLSQYVRLTLTDAAEEGGLLGLRF